MVLTSPLLGTKFQFEISSLCDPQTAEKARFAGLFSCLETVFSG
jgi:hypothetical protein